MIIINELLCKTPIQYMIGQLHKAKVKLVLDFAKLIITLRVNIIHMATKKVGRPRIKDKKVFIGVYVHPAIVSTPDKADKLRSMFKKVADKQQVAAGVK